MDNISSIRIGLQQTIDVWTVSAIKCILCHSAWCMCSLKCDSPDNETMHMEVRRDSGMNEYSIISSHKRETICIRALANHYEKRFNKVYYYMLKDNPDLYTFEMPADILHVILDYVCA